MYWRRLPTLQEARHVVDNIRPGIAGAANLDDAVAANVKAVIAQIRSTSPLLAQA